jgi:hypothetical protein
MFFIFGSRKKVKVIGPVFSQVCANCHNEKIWILKQITTWFTFFFIPLIPFDPKYIFVCPICNYGQALNKSQIAEFMPIVELNNQLNANDITAEEYNAKMETLKNKKTI